jgi:hypothetical protein
MTDQQYRCPACGFSIFNRRLAVCESCGGALPPDLLFSSEEKAALDAEHERSREKWRVKDKKTTDSPAVAILRLPWLGGGDG